MEENQQLSNENKKGLSPKAKKILNIAVDIVCGIILVLALIIAVSTITSRAKGYDQYTEIFGRAYLAVQSESMEKDSVTGEVKSDNFSKGDLIVIKTVKGDEAKKLKVGDVITFQTNRISDDGRMVLNTHRIVRISGTEGNATAFYTKGDNNAVEDPGFILPSDVVGVFQGKAGGIGNVVMFMGSTGGFLTFVLGPTLIIVIYAAINLVLVIMKERKVQAAVAEDAKAAERERMRAEIMAEMGVAPAATADQPAAPAENAQPAEAPAEQPAEPAEQPAEPVEEAPAGETQPAPALAKKPAAKPATTKTTAARPAAKSTTAKPAGTKPAAKSTTAKPAGTKPAAKPATAKPAGTKPAAKSATAKPTASKPAGKSTTTKKSDDGEKE